MSQNTPNPLNITFVSFHGFNVVGAGRASAFSLSIMLSSFLLAASVLDVIVGFRFLDPIGKTAAKTFWQYLEHFSKTSPLDSTWNTFRNNSILDIWE